MVAYFNVTGTFIIFISQGYTYKTKFYVNSGQNGHCYL